jgi:hypothetical protein
MPISVQELEIGPCEHLAGYSVRYRAGKLVVEHALEGSGGVEVGVDVLYAGFVEYDVRLSESEGVEEERLSGKAGRECERCGESCGGAIDFREGFLLNGMIWV